MPSTNIRIPGQCRRLIRCGALVATNSSSPCRWLPASNGGPTVADLAERYLEEHVAVRLKPRTQRRVRGMLHNHILPAFGRLPLAAVERSQVVEFHQKLSDHPVTANKAIKALLRMYRLAEGWGLVPEGCNPCRSVEKYPERSRERFLTDAEFTRLGRVLDEAVENGTASPTT